MCIRTTLHAAYHMRRLGLRNCSCFFSTFYAIGHYRTACNLQAFMLVVVLKYIGKFICRSFVVSKYLTFLEQRNCTKLKSFNAETSVANKIVRTRRKGDCQIKCF